MKGKVVSDLELPCQVQLKGQGHMWLHISQLLQNKEFTDTILHPSGSFGLGFLILVISGAALNKEVFTNFILTIFVCQDAKGILLQCKGQMSRSLVKLSEQE